jgi:sodium/potassium-transporting ATPase subunit beta
MENSPRMTQRRPTIVEETEETLLGAKKEIEIQKKENKKAFKDHLREFRQGFYNSEYREFLGRDSLAWFKLSVFYFIFYLLLSAFFVFLLFVFYETLDLKKPTYFNKKSVMHFREVNPGMGYRPQYDVENELISITPGEKVKNYESLEAFLKKYAEGKNTSFVGASSTKNVTFNYEEIIKDSPCTKEKHYGLYSRNPCVVVKLNRIYGWLPKPAESTPVPLTDANVKGKFVYIHCDGEYGTDRDNIKEVEYYSAYPGKEIGGIPFKYFPYLNQDNYLSPLVFVHFKNVSLNTLINVECKAYAKNIDHDRFNRRGSTQFQIFISDQLV